MKNTSHCPQGRSTNRPIATAARRRQQFQSLWAFAWGRGPLAGAFAKGTPHVVPYKASPVKAWCQISRLVAFLCLWAAAIGHAQNCPFLQLLCSNTNIPCGTPIPSDPPPYYDPCCPDVTVTLLGSTSTRVGCTNVISQTWQAVDLCYFITNTCTQTVTVLPSTPTLLCNDIQVTCGSLFPTNPPAYYDPCCTNVIVRLVHRMTNSPPNACNFNVAEVWQAIDLCCNTTNTCSRTIFAMPSAPTILCTNLSLKCFDMSYTNPPAYTDLCCTNVTMTLLGSGPISSTMCSMTFTQTWQALDQCCGLASICIRSVTSSIPVPPSFFFSSMCGMTVTNTCGTPLPPPPMAFDPCCPDVTVSLLSSVTNYFNPGHCGMAVTQSWVAVEHCCGTASTCTRTFFFMPSPPTLLCSNLTFSCTDTNSLTNPPPVVDVCCSSVMVMLTSSVTNFVGRCNVVITQTWMAHDMCCGLSTVCTRTISLVPTPPTFLCTNLIATCGDTSFMTNPPPYISPCCTNVMVTLLDSTFTGTMCSGVMTQTWGAAEMCCGTGSTCTRTITFVPTPPTLLCTNLTASCGDTNFMTPPAYISPCCSNVMVTLVDTTGAGTMCSGILTQTWQAVELCCGSSNTCTRIVTMLDTNPPTITCPSNMVVATCGTNAIVSWTVTATDNCAVAGVSSSPPSGSSFLPNTTNTVTCTAWDLCSNTNTCTFTIKVVRPTLGLVSITNSAGTITVSWAAGILQQASDVLGPWTDVPGAVPPSYSTTPTAASAFYRLRCNSP
ncbi:MAG: hypothetical protein C5B50_06885 [Verrucomicrobia bacterium]|nr:MAG: hypothetical protein C5B50_06885 [Verrucomicrobiota bacterium]